MKVVVPLSSCCSLPYSSNTIKSFSRRELFFDTLSSFSSNSTPSQRRIGDCNSSDVIDNHVQPNFSVTSRRELLRSFGVFSCYFLSTNFPAYALGDPLVTVEEVTPQVFPSGPLLPSEERVVQLFENNTYSVVNIFDVTLRPQLNVTGVVEVPEGNGSGVIWDGQGHIVTNYHVIGNSLSRNPSSGQVVARVNILASDGVQKSFQGILIGADRAKDLAVLKHVPMAFWEVGNPHKSHKCFGVTWRKKTRTKTHLKLRDD